jgi:uncharacterized protein YndB with AHSA1/START domain
VAANRPVAWGDMKTIVIERDFDAPRQLVFEAWTDPKHIVHWFHASRDWTTPHAKTDLRPGGAFSIGFASPDGKNDFDFAGTYNEINPPESLVFTLGDGRPVVLTLTEIGKRKTHLRLEFAMETTNSEAKQREGWTAMVVHLGEYLATV